MARAMNAPEIRELHDHLRPYLYAAIGALFVIVATAWWIAVFVIYVWPRPSTDLSRLVTNHFRAIVGVPGEAIAAFVVVWTLSVTAGQIEFEAWGLKFKGAAGPVIFWVLVFLAITTAVNWSW